MVKCAYPSVTVDLFLRSAIVITMNIYIKPQNEELLRRYDGSMSGLVNRLLENFFSGNPAAATGVRREVDKADEKIAAEPRYVVDEDTHGAPETNPGTPRSGLEPLYRNKKKGKL